MSPAERAVLEAALSNLRAAALSLEGLLAVVPPPPPVDPDPNWKLVKLASFAQGKVPSSLYPHTRNKDASGVMQTRLKFVDLPWKPGTLGAKISIVPGDRWNGTAGYPRSEFMFKAGDNTVLYGVEYALELTCQIGGTIPVKGELLFGFQLHDDTNGSPPIALALKDGKFMLVCRWARYDGHWQPLSVQPVLNRAHKIRVEFKASRGPDGFARCYVDGVLAAEYHGQIGYQAGDRAGYYGQIGYQTGDRAGYIKGGGWYDYNKTAKSELTLTVDSLGWYMRS